MRILGAPIPLLLSYYQHTNWKPSNRYESLAYNEYCDTGAEDRYKINTITEMSSRMKIKNFKNNYENLFIFCLNSNYYPIESCDTDYLINNETKTEEIQYGEVDLFE